MPSAVFPLSTSESLPLNLLRSLRPRQWTKNLFVFGALVFAQRLGDRPSLVHAVIAFFVFCALSGAVYLVNDVLDREQDRRHPLKAQRPIASGALGVNAALVEALVLALGALIVASSLGLPLFATAARHLALLLAYSTFLNPILLIHMLQIPAGIQLLAV